jgi:hypothetical protein
MSNNPSRKRTFASVAESEIQKLQTKKYAKRTEYSRSSVRKLFLDFLITKGIHAVPADDPSSMNNVLMEFWPSVRQHNGAEYRASTLQTMRNTLHSILLDDFSVDIFNNVSFGSSDSVFTNYLKSLKEKGLGFVRHYPDIYKEDLSTILNTLDENDPQQLQWMTWIFIMLFFCRRGVENLANMEKSHIKEKMSNKGVKYLIFEHCELTKNHQEINEDIESGGVICEVQGNPKCPLRTTLKYMSLLHPSVNYLWQRPKAKITETESIWYAKQKLGHNTMANMMRNICKYVKLEKCYTNHSLRATSCTLLGELGYTDLEVQAVSQHKSISALGIYKRTKLDKKSSMSGALANAIGITSGEGSTTNAICIPEGQVRESRDFPFISTDAEAYKMQNFFLDLVEEDVTPKKTSRVSSPLLAVPGKLFDAEKLNPEKVLIIQNCHNITINF